MNEFQKFELVVEKAKQKDIVLKNNLKNNFFSLVKEILKNKNINSVYWTQYTPFFNDGEECVFRVNSLNCEVNMDFYRTQDRYADFIDEPTNARHIRLFYDIDLFEAENKADIEMVSYGSLLELKDIKLFAEQEKNMEAIFLLSKLANLMTSEYFEKILLDTLGNHIQVRINNGENDIEVEIEGYDHD
jgi:hypothetical protein